MPSEADLEAVERLTAAEPVWTGMARAGDVIAGLDDGLVLHAGPPISPADLPGPVRGALTGALVLEGRAADADAAARLVDAGEVDLASAHDHGAVGPVAGIITASMPVVVVEDPVSGVVAHATLNEGLGRVLRFGAHDDAVLHRLRWIADVAAPTLDRAVRSRGGISLTTTVAEALNRGDECHNRNKAATAQVVRTLAGAVARTAPSGEAADVLEYMAGNDHFFLNLSMATGKAATLAVGPVEGSGLVTAMAANGRSVGIRTAGTGDTWFTASAPQPSEGRWLEGHTAVDACALLGDSFVTEVTGVGAFAAAAAPAIATYIGGSVRSLAAVAEEMRTITIAEHPRYRIAALDYRGTPVGIDVRAVERTGIAPVVNAGFASRHAGVGQVGAGLVRMPIGCFAAAAHALGPRPDPVASS